MLSQTYVMQPYGFDKVKIATAIVGVCSLAIGLTTFLFFYLIWEDLILAAIFLTTFLSASIVCIIVAIIRHVRKRPIYWGAATYYPQYPPTSYQTPQQPAYFPDYSQRPYENWSQYQYSGSQTPSNYPTYQSTSWDQNSSNWSSWQNPWGGQQRCPTCNQPIRYVGAYQRWLCETCNKWF